MASAGLNAGDFLSAHKYYTTEIKKNLDKLATLDADIQAYIKKHAVPPPKQTDPATADQLAQRLDDLRRNKAALEHNLSCLKAATSVLSPETRLGITQEIARLQQTLSDQLGRAKQRNRENIAAHQQNQAAINALAVLYKERTGKEYNKAEFMAQHGRVVPPTTTAGNNTQTTPTPSTAPVTSPVVSPFNTITPNTSAWNAPQNPTATTFGTSAQPTFPSVVPPTSIGPVTFGGSAPQTLTQPNLSASHLPDIQKAANVERQLDFSLHDADSVIKRYEGLLQENKSIAKYVAQNSDTPASKETNMKVLYYVLMFLISQTNKA